MNARLLTPEDFAKFFVGKIREAVSDEMTKECD